MTMSICVRQLCKFAIDVVLRLCFSANLVVIVTPQEERNLNDNVKQFFTLNNRQLCKFAIDVVLRLCFSANLVVIVTPQEERGLNDI
ncbi:hypothetical protein T02_564 [Trichinella nativa]|uniref:Uncharacterized protein n=2 Tax=Trichinella TaxID=6333 RepID=A0A0V1L7J5_9BILA|nr:hypothetical protein T02_564 [Trichinella nativa]